MRGSLAHAPNRSDISSAVLYAAHRSRVSGPASPRRRAVEQHQPAAPEWALQALHLDPRLEPDPDVPRLWWLADGQDLARAGAVATRLRDLWNEVAGFKCCDATIDAGTRLLRLPGTYNVKVPARPQRCTVGRGKDRLWPLAELEAALPEPIAAAVTAPATSTPPSAAKSSR